MTETPDSDKQHADWNQVGAAFTALGDRIQAHFSGLTAKAPSPDSSAPFEQLGKSLDEALTKFREAVSDPAISDAAQSAADQLLAALRTEVDSASDTVSGTFDRVSDKVDEIANAGKDTTDTADPAADNELPPGGGSAPSA